MRLHSLKKNLFFIFILCCIPMVSAQYNLPKKPTILYPVYDEVGLLSNQEKNALNEKLIKFEDSTSTEIEVIIIPTTKGEDINYVAWEFGRKWEIGKKNINNGVVLLVATEDRKISIQQGRAVEEHLTAAIAGQIIDYIISPNFREGKWYEGLNRGTSAIMESVEGKFQPIKNTSEEGLTSAEIILFIFIVIFILIFISNLLDKNNRNNNDDDDVIISKRGRTNYPGGFFGFPTGGGFGRSSGGSFGGFGGGGSFGGGGASGGW